MAPFMTPWDVCRMHKAQSEFFGITVALEHTHTQKQTLGAPHQMSRCAEKSLKNDRKRFGLLEENDFLMLFVPAPQRL